MTVSYASVTTNNMELTPCRVKFNTVDIGGTNANVKVSITYKKADIKADQLGDTILDRRVSGTEIKIETVLAEISKKENWKVAFPNSTLVTSGGNKAIFFGSKVGEADSALAYELILHPLSRSDADLSGDFKFYKAVAESVSEVTFGPTEQQGLKVVWNVLPDTGSTPAKFMFVGDPAVGLIAASAGSPVKTGTGDGVLDTVTVNSGYTKTETVTATCEGVEGGGDTHWSVSGSVTGIIGVFTLTGASETFTSNYINFNITKGSTNWIIGDYWTIATVAANYV